MKKIFFLAAFIVISAQAFPQIIHHPKILMGIGAKANPLMLSIPIFLLGEKNGAILEINTNFVSAKNKNDLSDVMSQPFSWWRETSRKKSILFFGIGFLKKITKDTWLKGLMNLGQSCDVVSYFSTASHIDFKLKQNEEYVYGGEIGFIYNTSHGLIDVAISYPGLIHLSYDWEFFTKLKK